MDENFLMLDVDGADLFYRRLASLRSILDDIKAEGQTNELQRNSGNTAAHTQLARI